MVPAKGYAAMKAGKALQPFTFDRRQPGPQEVPINIRYCGICHSDFCAERGITCDVEVIPIQQVNEAYERVLRGDVRYRFVLDPDSLK